MATDDAALNSERFDVGADELRLIVQFAHGRLNTERLCSQLADLRWPADDARLLAGYLQRQVPIGRRRPPGYRGPHYAD